MNLPLTAPHLPLAAPTPQAAPPSAPDGQGWRLQLARASAVLGVPEVAARESDRADLESCGFPVAAGAAQAVRAVPQQPASAAPEEALPPRAGCERATGRAPLRVHVQDEPAEGLRVWLGIDGDAALVAQTAGAVLTGLRRGPLAAARIVSVVCNGVPVYPHAALESPLLKEASWPSAR